MTTVKVKLGSEIRRFQYEDGTNFKQLDNLLHQLYPELSSRSHCIKYIDEENDLIPIATDLELLEAINVAKNSKPPILRLSLIFPETTANQIESISNWGKKLIEEQNTQSQTHHVVKVCGQEVEVIPKTNSNEPTVNVSLHVQTSSETCDKIEPIVNNNSQEKTKKKRSKKLL